MALMNTGVSLLALVLLIHSVVGQGYVRTEIGCSARCLAKCFNDESPNGAEVRAMSH